MERKRTHIPRGALLREAVPSTVVHGGQQRLRRQDTNLFLGPRTGGPAIGGDLQIPQEIQPRELLQRLFRHHSR